MLDVRTADGGATLRVRVSPRSSRNGLAGERDGALLVRITAPPVEGAANAALTRLLARILKVPASGVQVRQGASGRDKVLHVGGLDAAEVRARLDAAGAGR